MKRGLNKISGKLSSGQLIWQGLMKLTGGAAIVLSILLTAGISLAQQPDRGFRAANIYAATGLETVNTTNGNLMLNIPVASLPAGRGTSPGYSVNLQYNSKLWDSRQTVEPGINDINGNPTYYSATDLTLSPKGGWGLYSSYTLGIIDRSSFTNPDPCRLGDPVEKLAFRWKVEMAMPDGSVRQFFPETGRSNQVGTYIDGYANIDHNGVRYTAVENLPGTPNCYTTVSTSQVTTSGMTYITMDGSRLRLFIPYQPAVAYWLRNWKFYFPDGTLVEGYPPDNPAVSQRMTDRNGNYVEHIGNKIIDQLGRYIEFTSDANPGSIIRVKGVGGETVDIRLIWGTRWVRKQYARAIGSNVPSGVDNTTLYQSFPVVEKIIFPAQLGTQEMTFEYNGSATDPGETSETEAWGEMKSVTQPGGAKSNYQYVFNGFVADLILKTRASRKDLEYTEQYDGASPVGKTDTWLYAENRVTSPSGAVNEESVIHYFQPQTAPLWDEAMTYRSVNPDGSIVERLWGYNLPYSMTGTVPNTPGGWSGIGSGNAYVKTEFITLADANGNVSSNSLTAIKDYKYDKNGNVLEIREYDWVTYGTVPRGAREGCAAANCVTGLPTSGLLLKRKTVNSYYNQAADADSPTGNFYSYSDASSPKLKNVIKSTEIQDGGGNPVARSEFFYDDPNNKGNLIETRVWDSTKGVVSNPLTISNSISSTVQYDAYGNPTLTTDTKGNQTQITYGAINGYTGLYPTEVKSAYQTAIQQTVQSEYDFYTGLPKKVTALGNTANENVSSETVYDALGRPLIAKAAVNTPVEIWTQSEYNDAARRVIVRSDLFTRGDGKKIAVQHYDQLGRVRLSRTIENVATEDPYNETHGIKVQTRYLMGNPNSYSLTSNPYRAAYSFQATNEPTMGWTRSLSVNTGRHAETETFSGASLPAPWSNNTSSTGKVQTDIDADRTLVTDQAGKQRISKTNALGQLTDIWEVTTADAATTSVSFPNQTIMAGYQTSYQYDTLNNLKKVVQGTQPTRDFAYNSLSRLLSANNPESGLVSYQYDANGNPTRKTDARNIQTNYSYDALNRVMQRSYANEPTGQTTPSVTYTYDNLTNAKGRLTKISSSVSTTEYTSFDILGRVLAHKQTTDGNAYTTGYAYNLSGALIEETYPSTRVVKNVLDNDGDLTIVQSRKNANAGYFNYAKNFTYTASGAVSSMQLGNGKWESTSFNSRLQPTQIALGTVQNGTDRLKLNYDYGTTTNNGNVLSQQITVPTVGANQGFTATQIYTYDSLNRLKSAVENIGATQTWKQTFIFDRYGNRNFDTVNTTTLGSCPANQCNPTIDTTNNRFTTGQGYTFDLAGNIITDAQGRSFTYDAESKQKEVRDGNNAVVGQYLYDGDGKRVKKYVPASGETTIFVYDASGKMVAEYSTISPPQPQVSYLTTDHLGSPRIITNENGMVTSRRDFHPFGEEIYTAQRTSSLNYTADNTRQKFTGYIRDGETNLDFAQARYYAKNLGRFYSVDPENAGAREDDPQSWNGYFYAGNNPLLYVDPNGEDYEICDTSGKCYGRNTDPEFEKARKSGGFKFENGKITGLDGTPLGTYRYINPTEPIGEGPGVLERIAGGTLLGGIIGGGSGVVGTTAGIIGGIAGGIAGGAAGGSGGANSGNNSGMVLPPNASIDIKAIKHIVEDHAWNTTKPNKGRFAPSTTIPQLKTYIKTATLQATPQPGKFGGRIVFEYRFPTSIGVNGKGNLSNTIRVIMEPNGRIVTAFPI